jgi:sulfate adenylyltransferase subunit 1
LLRETGVVIITDLADATDVSFTAEQAEELAEQIVKLVRL